MGVRLNPSANPLEASVKDGHLYVYCLDKVIRDYKIPLPTTLEFERQINFFDTPRDNLFAYLMNDTYILIIRYDGTMDILTRGRLFMFRHNVVINDMFGRALVSVHAGSVLTGRGSSGYSMCTVTKYDDIAVLSCTDIRMNIYFKPTEENNRIVNSILLSASPASLVLRDNSTKFTMIWADTLFASNTVLKDIVVIKK